MVDRLASNRELEHWSGSQTILYLGDGTAQNKTEQSCSLILENDRHPELVNLIKTLFQFGGVTDCEYWKFQEGLY